MRPLTVACVWVQGHVPYTVEYVVRLHAMVRRWSDRPLRFVCLTDRPAAVQAHGLEAIAIPSPGALKGWWRKVELHNPAHGLTGRVLALDLDVLIVGPIAPIVDVAAPFALAPHAGTFHGKDGLAIVPRFNSSVQVFDAGTTGDLHAAWTPAVAARLWGDQDWIGERRPDAATLPAAWVPRLSACDPEQAWPAGATIVLCKVPKPAIAAARWPRVREAWA